MTSRSSEHLQKLERRLARLENLVVGASQPPLSREPAYDLHPGVPLGLGVVVLGCGYLGLGLPQHYYQPLFAGLVLALAYHRRVWILAAGYWRWPLVAVNFLTLVLFFKLLIGGGTRYPLDWLRVPTLEKAPPREGSPWYDQLFPTFDLQWEGIPAITDISIDITLIQSMLLLATLAGALFRFQPFASLTAVVLLLVSVPTLLNFNWDWVVLFLVLGGIALYLQSGALNLTSISPPQKRR